MSKFLDEKGLRQLIELIRNLNSEGESELPDITPADAGKVLIVNSEGKLELAEIELPGGSENIINLKLEGTDPTSGEWLVYVYKDGDYTHKLSYNDVMEMANNTNLPITLRDPNNFMDPREELVNMYLYKAWYNDSHSWYCLAFDSFYEPSMVMLYSPTKTDPLLLSITS